MSSVTDLTWDESVAGEYLSAGIARIPYTIWREYQGPDILQIIQFLARTTYFHREAAQGKLYEAVMRAKSTMPDPRGFLAYCIHASLKGGNLKPKQIERIRENGWVFSLFSLWDPDMETYPANEIAGNQLQGWISTVFDIFLREDSSDGRLSAPEAAFRNHVLSKTRVMQANKIGILWGIPGVDLSRDPEVIRQEYEGDQPAVQRKGIMPPPRRRQVPQQTESRPQASQSHYPKTENEVVHLQTLTTIHGSRRSAPKRGWHEAFHHVLGTGGEKLPSFLENLDGHKEQIDAIQEEKRLLDIEREALDAEERELAQKQRDIESAHENLRVEEASHRERKKAHEESAKEFGELHAKLLQGLDGHAKRVNTLRTSLGFGSN